MYSERATQGCNAIHRGSENVIDPFKTIKLFKKEIIILSIHLDVIHNFLGAGK